MSYRPWIAIFTSCVSLTVIALWLGRGPRESEHDLRARERPLEIDTSRVREWSFSMDDIPFANGNHIVRLDELIPCEGALATQGIDRPKHRVIMYRIVLRPAGTDEVSDSRMDSIKDFRHEVTVPVVQGRANSSLVFKSKHLSTGVYHARLYFNLMDFEGHNRETETDLLATATVTLTN